MTVPSISWLIRLCCVLNKKTGQQQHHHDTVKWQREQAEATILTYQNRIIIKVVPLDTLVVCSLYVGCFFVLWLQ